jgi:hypothetical protein
MKLAWLFGPTLEQHHLLYVYLSVWIIQGGYCAWVATQWLRARNVLSPSTPSPTSAPHRNPSS